MGGAVANKRGIVRKIGGMCKDMCLNKVVAMATSTVKLSMTLRCRKII